MIKELVQQASSVPEMVQAVHKPVMQAVNATAFAVYLNDPKTNELFAWYVVGSPHKDVRVKRSGDNVVGYVATTGKSVRMADAHDPSAVPKYPNDDKLQFVTQQVIAVPLIHQNASLGVLVVMNRPTPAPFTAADEQTLVEIGKVVGEGFFNLRAQKKPAGAPASQQQASPQQQAPSGQTVKPGKWSYLVARGLLTQDKLDQAIAEAQRTKTDPGLHFVQQLGLPRKEVGQALSEYYRVPFFDYDGSQRIADDLRPLIKPDFLQRYKCAPLKREAGTLLIVVDDPSDAGRIDMLRSSGNAATAAVLVGLTDDIFALIEASYAGPQESMSKILESAADEDFGVEEAAPASGEIGEADSAVVKVVNQIIREAYERGVSDIHIEPNGTENPVAVRFRKDGDCYLHQELPVAFRRAVTARIKIMAKLDIAERRKPQDGKIRLQLNNKKVELRVATIPTTEENEDVVMRILAASKPLPLEKMGFSAYNLTEFKRILDMPYGLVLVVGPTGSGKTTTLHSGLGFINTADRKIWTAEDPVEITQRGLRQVQVNAKIDFTFAAAMRAFLRADPDVIMVGEMRDQETAEIGVEASLTGHLVLSTLHTNSAPETVTRLLDMELDPFSFADALLGVLAQRLLRTLCSACKEAYTPDEAELSEVRRAFGHDERFNGLLAKGTPSFYRPKGCPACGNTGYKGRMGIHELLLGSDEIKAQIQHKAPISEIRSAAIASGMWTLLQDGVAKVFAGATDFRQVAAVCIK